METIQLEKNHLVCIFTALSSLYKRTSTEEKRLQIRHTYVACMRGFPIGSEMEKIARTIKESMEASPSVALPPLRIYCEDCDEEFTVIQGPSLIDFCCPECGGGKTEVK